MCITSFQNESKVYSDQGFVLFKNVFSEKDCLLLKQRARTLISQIPEPPKPIIFSSQDQSHAVEEYFLKSANNISVFYEKKLDPQTKKLVPNKIAHALQQDELYRSWCFSPKLMDILTALGIQKPKIVQSMHIFKAPFVGESLDIHQDATYLLTEPQSLITLWIALDEAHEKNGCLQVIPGGHRGPLRYRHYRNSEGVLVTEQRDPTPWGAESLVSIPASRGDVIAFDGMLPHASGENLSADPRDALVIQYYDSQKSIYCPDNWLIPSDSA